MTTERQMTWDEVVAEMVRYRERASASDDLLRQAIEALRAIVARSQTDELGTSKVIDMRNLASAVLTAYDKREQS